MDAVNIAALASNLSQTRTDAAIQTAVLKKAIEAQEQGALQLLEALPQISNNPAHLGQNLDTYA